MTQKPLRLGHFVLSRIGLSLLVIVFILLIPAACSGDEKPPSVRSEGRLYAGPLNANLADFVEKLDRKVPPLLDGYGTPGASIALVNNGELAWARGYGWADAAKKRPVTPETVFGVASVSKTFAAWGVMRLAEQGRLDLDAPIEQYLTRWHLPPSKFDSRLVTARRLLSHTAGISWRPQCDKEPRSLEEALLDECKNGAPAIIERTPGEFSYSGHGYTMLQLAIEEITHESFADYMKREVLAPLGIDGAGYRPADFSQPLGLGYCRSEAKPEVWPLPLADQVLQALGGLDATAPAVGQFVAAAMAGPSGARPGRDVLSPQTIGTMLTSAPGTEGASLFDGTDSFGLGYGLKTGGGDARMVLHSGGNACWSAIFPRLSDRAL